MGLDFSDGTLASLKIEGRKKSPLYVAAAVSYYRHLLDNTFTPAARAAAERDLRIIFSRPWTDLHLRARRNPACIDTAAANSAPHESVRPMKPRLVISLPPHYGFDESEHSERSL